VPAGRYGSLVRFPGPVPWSGSLVRFPGPIPWSGSLVPWFRILTKKYFSENFVILKFLIRFAAVMNIHDELYDIAIDHAHRTAPVETGPEVAKAKLRIRALGFCFTRAKACKDKGELQLSDVWGEVFWRIYHEK